MDQLISKNCLLPFEIGDINLVYKWLQEFECHTHYIDSALCLAVKNNYIEIVQVLLTHGAQINLCNNVLIYACHNNNVSMVQILIQYVHDINILNDALSVICSNTDNICVDDTMYIVKLFIDCGADINVGFTSAVSTGNLDVMDLLISSGANIINVNGFETAVYSGHYEVINVMIQKGFDLKLCNKYIMDGVCCRGDMCMVELLYNAGIDLTTELLVSASKSGNIDLVKFIFDNIPRQNSYWNAFREAVYYGHYHVVKFFILNGERCGTLCTWNDIFCGSAMRGYIDILTLFVENNDRKSLLDAHGACALHNACVYNKLEVVSYLISLGIDVNSVSNIYPPTCAIVIAVSNGHHLLVQLLIDNGVNLQLHPDLLDISILCGNLSTVKILVDNGFNIHKNDERVLQLAINLGFFNIADYLISIGANINNKFVLINTALICQLEILYEYCRLKSTIDNSVLTDVDTYEILINADVDEHNNIFLQSNNKSEYYEFIKNVMLENIDVNNINMLKPLYYVLGKIENMADIIAKTDIFILAYVKH